MYTKDDLIKDIRAMGIKPTDTLMIHSSMKAIGKVDGGAETVLDAFIEYMKDGLLIFPTHSWDKINSENNLYDPRTQPSCVGLLTNLFMKRPETLRSWHPTHSVAAQGQDAEAYIQGEEKTTTACPRFGCWGKLYDRKAKILFLGCSMKRNTYIHGVEEWCDVPDRIAAVAEMLLIKTPDGRILECPQFRHHSPIEDISSNYAKLQIPLVKKGIAIKGFIGAAESYLCDAVDMADLTTEFLKKNPDLFLDNNPVPMEWFI
ncbi:MAG: AAC(3) family N-acetyltransferase [Spirochaetaceae bacterium]|jgi:aminoglycoside 3-N-acetyltransferase|nr:AAC(3) family N-acetyltransferase [Spirochaetaceae bacterium]